MDKNILTQHFTHRGKVLIIVATLLAVQSSFCNGRGDDWLKVTEGSIISLEHFSGSDMMIRNKGNEVNLAIESL